MPVYRFLEYRRVIWLEGGPLSLEDQCRQAFNSLPLTTERVVTRSDGTNVMGLRMRDVGQRGVFVHCGRYVDDQATGVIPMNEQRQTQVNSRRPGNAENFLNSDFLGLLFGNHVITLNAGINGASLGNYLRGLFGLAEMNEDCTKFDLVRIADVNKLAKIRSSGGVSSLKLDLAIDEAVHIALTDHVPEPANPSLGWGVRQLLAPVSEAIGDLIKNYEPASGLASSTKGTVKLEISVPAGDAILARNGMDGTAQLLVEDEDADDYVIKLRNGDTIKPSEISLKKRVRLDRFANSVDVNQAEDHMLLYAEELREGGLLE